MSDEDIDRFYDKCDQEDIDRAWWTAVHRINRKDMRTINYSFKHKRGDNK